jgi:hypothetical protein
VSPKRPSPPSRGASSSPRRPYWACAFNHDSELSTVHDSTSHRPRPPPSHSSCLVLLQHRPPSPPPPPPRPPLAAATANLSLLSSLPLLERRPSLSLGRPSTTLLYFLTPCFRCRFFGHCRSLSGESFTRQPLRSLCLGHHHHHHHHYYHYHYHYLPPRLRVPPTESLETGSSLRRVPLSVAIHSIPYFASYCSDYFLVLLAPNYRQDLFFLSRLVYETSLSWSTAACRRAMSE